VKFRRISFSTRSCFIHQYGRDGELWNGNSELVNEKKNDGVQYNTVSYCEGVYKR